MGCRVRVLPGTKPFLLFAQLRKKGLSMSQSQVTRKPHSRSFGRIMTVTLIASLVFMFGPFSSKSSDVAVAAVVGDATYPSDGEYPCPGGGGFTLTGTTISPGSGNNRVDCAGDLVIPDGVTRLDYYAFSQSKITSVFIPASVQIIDFGAFSYSSIETVTFAPSSNLTTIGNSAFVGSKLTSISIPASVTSIESSFVAIPTLTSVYFEGTSAPSLISDPFSGNSQNIDAIILQGATGFDSPGSTWNLMTIRMLVNVGFESQLGSTVANQTLVPVGTSPVTTRTGYNFLGWFDAPTGGNEITFPYAPSADKTLYAQWQQITHNVTFDAQSGSSVALQNTASVTTSPTTTQSGFMFQGWFDAATDGNEITFPYAPSADVTLYAQWVSATPPTPAPYAGALPTGYSNTTPSIGDEVVVSGLRLNLVTSCSIDGVAAEITEHSADSFTIVIPAGLQPGLKDLVISSSAGKLTAQGAFTVESKPIIITESPAVISKANAGAQNGHIAVFAKGHKGKTLAWKIAGKWFKTTVTSDYQVFQRRTAAVGLDVDVHLYIDGEKQLTKTVTTR